MILVLDSETTGRNQGVHEIVQIAGVLLDDADPALPEVASYASYMRPLRPHVVDPQAMEVNKLTVAGLLLERHPAEVIAEFAAFAGSRGVPLACGHWVSFDLGMLAAAEREHRVTVPRRVGELCTCKIAKKHLAGVTANHKLGTVAAHYGITFDGAGAHDAMSDVRVTAEVLRRMYREEPRLFTGLIAPPLLAPATDHLAPTPKPDPTPPRAPVVQLPAGPAPQSPLEELMAELAAARARAEAERNHAQSTLAYLDLLEAEERYHATPQHQAAKEADAAVLQLEAMLREMCEGTTATVQTPWGEVGYRARRSVTHSPAAVRALAPELAPTVITETVDKKLLEAAARRGEISRETLKALEARAEVRIGALQWVCAPVAEAGRQTEEAIA